MGIQTQQSSDCADEESQVAAGLSGFAYVRDLPDEESPEDGCVALSAFGRRRMFRVRGNLRAAAREILADITAEEGEDLGYEYGIRAVKPDELVIECLRRPYGPRADYNDVGETQDPKFYGGPAPEGWMAVL